LLLEETVNRNAFLVFAATVSIIYAIGNLLVPAWVHELHGLTSSPSASLVSRFLGSALLGLGVIVWMARHCVDSDALSAIMRGGLVVAAAGFIVSVHATTAGLMNSMGWVLVVVQGLLALGFVFFGSVRR
jgi:hypothetical protein